MISFSIFSNLFWHLQQLYTVHSIYTCNIAGNEICLGKYYIVHRYFSKLSQVVTWVCVCVCCFEDLKKYSFVQKMFAVVNLFLLKYFLHLQIFFFKHNAFLAIAKHVFALFYHLILQICSTDAQFLFNLIWLSW